MLLLSLPVSAQEVIFEDSFEDIAIWISQVNGNWNDGFNWKSGSPPADGEVVIINVPTEVEVTIDAGPLVVSSIVSEELLLINTTLTVTDGCDFGSEDHYYLVVVRRGLDEGTYGWSSLGDARPPSAALCP